MIGGDGMRAILRSSIPVFSCLDLNVKVPLTFWIQEGHYQVAQIFPYPVRSKNTSGALLLAQNRTQSFENEAGWHKTPHNHLKTSQ